jgi:hypothetical protein
VVAAGGGGDGSDRSSQNVADPASAPPTTSTASDRAVRLRREVGRTRTVSSVPGCGGLMRRPPARRGSGAEVDHPHATIARLRRLRRGGDQQLSRSIA